jgi:hypothetical protein
LTFRWKWSVCAGIAVASATAFLLLWDRGADRHADMPGFSPEQRREYAALVAAAPAEAVAAVESYDRLEPETKLLMLRVSVIQERTSKAALDKTPFDTDLLVPFAAEVFHYKPLAPGEADSSRASSASHRAHGSLETFSRAWIAAGPFSDAERDHWIGQATRLATDTDPLVRVASALTLWTLSNVPEHQLPPQSASALEQLRKDHFVESLWEKWIEIFAEDAKRAGRDWKFN